jgi:hypothetical protein
VEGKLLKRDGCNFPVKRKCCLISKEDLFITHANGDGNVKAVL